MTTREIYELSYSDSVICSSCSDKYEWAANEIFGLTTYDGRLDELFVKKIIEVSKAILENCTFEYIKDDSKYIPYILVCQLFERRNWIDWGTSIRGAWFNFGDYRDVRPIIPKYDPEDLEVPFTEENFIELIKFIEEEEE